MCKIETHAALAEKADRSSECRKERKTLPSPWRLSRFLGEQKILGDNKQGVCLRCTTIYIQSGGGTSRRREWVGNGIGRGALLQAATIKSQPAKISG
jgi:hypothetical protein